MTVPKATATATVTQDGYAETSNITYNEALTDEDYNILAVYPQTNTHEEATGQGTLSLRSPTKYIQCSINSKVIEYGNAVTLTVKTSHETGTLWIYNNRSLLQYSNITERENSFLLSLPYGTNNIFVEWQFTGGQITSDTITVTVWRLSINYATGVGAARLIRFYIYPNAEDTNAITVSKEDIVIHGDITSFDIVNTNNFKLQTRLNFLPNYIEYMGTDAPPFIIEVKSNNNGLALSFVDSAPQWMNINTLYSVKSFVNENTIRTEHGLIKTTDNIDSTNVYDEEFYYVGLVSTDIMQEIIGEGDMLITQEDVYQVILVTHLINNPDNSLIIISSSYELQDNLETNNNVITVDAST